MLFLLKYRGIRLVAYTCLLNLGLSTLVHAQPYVRVDLAGRSVYCALDAKGRYIAGKLAKNGAFTPFSKQINQLKRKAKSAPEVTRARLEKKLRTLKKRSKQDTKACRDSILSPLPTATPLPPGGCKASALSFAVTLPEKASIEIRLSGSDSCGQQLSFRLLSQPEKGVLSGNPPQLTYTAGYSRGNDQFSYIASNGSSDSEPALVTIVTQIAAGEFAGAGDDLQPYREALSEAEVRHLLDKVALGGDAELVQIGLTQGLSSLVEALISRNVLHADVEAQAEEIAKNLREQYCVTINVAPPGSPAQNVRFCSADRYFPTATSESIGWLHNLRHGQPLREKMALLWHDHFAVNLGIGSFGTERRLYIKDHLDLLRRYALNFHRSDGGKEGFDYFLKAMHFDGAMNLWLDNFLNTYSENNENYGREITELFALGLKDPVTWANHYSESDILNVVKAFAGFFEGSVRYQELPIEVFATGYESRLVSSWMRNFVDWSAFRWMPDPNNPVSLTLFPGSAYEASHPFRYDSVTDYILASHPGSARYLSSKIFAALVHPQPFESVVAALAQSWIASAYDIEELTRRILRSAAMFSLQARDTCVADPVESLVSFARKLNLPLVYSDGSGNIYATVRSGAANGGKTLLQAPSVFGWKGCGINRDGVIAHGEIWLGTQTVLGRRNAFISLLNEIYRRRTELSFAWESLLPAGDAAKDPSRVLDHLALALNVRLSSSDHDKLVTYLTHAQPSGGGAPIRIEWDPSSSALMATKIPGLLEILANHPSFTLL